MRNARCTSLPAAEEEQLLSTFPQYLTEAQEALARQFFDPLVFFRRSEEDRSARWCVCTSCMEGFYAHKQTAREFFKAVHGGSCECPNCGQASTLLAIGKFKDFSSLRSRERTIQISTCGEWLLVQAGWLTRTFDHEDLGGDLDFEPLHRYVFAPGRQVMWSRDTVSWMWERHVSGPWERQSSIREPFQRQYMEQEASYIPLGLEALDTSSMRYCQYGSWFKDEFGVWLDDGEQPFRIAHLIRYLSEYTRRPQMEFLAKLGHLDVLRDLVIDRHPHGDLLNWRAKTPPEFFRMSKADYRAFADSGLHVKALDHWRELRREGLAFQDFLGYRKQFGDRFETVLDLRVAAGVSLDRAVRYVRRQAGTRSIQDAIQLWRDYLDNARRLDYDLSREDVAMPKDLLARHDQTAAAVRATEDERQNRRYGARRMSLEDQFGFEWDGLCVRVPACIQEIVEEGKTLRHCVGGYAARHVGGQVTILFLRESQAPETPYVTMELSTEANCKKLQIRQIHGYENDRGAKVPPAVRHRAFLDLWLDWVHRGSPRRKDGTPDIREPAQARTA